MSNKLKNAKEEALWGLLVADALAMPVHWYYNPGDIKQGYGDWLTGYVAPNKNHPSSILSLSATDGSGRTGASTQSKTVVGNIILHDKLKYWTSGNRSIHYHQGMKAGDNTLNALTALEFMKTFDRVDSDLTKPEREVRAGVLEDYVKFMTTPGTHNDTYAESFHRSFFKDWTAAPGPPKHAKDLIQFAEERFQKKVKEPDSQLAVIGSLVLAIPWILQNAHKSESECAKATIDFVKLTHPVMSLLSFVDIYSRLLHAVLNGHDLKTECLKFLSHSELGGPGKRDKVLRLLDKAQSSTKGSEYRLKANQEAIGTLGSACYIEGAVSSLLFLALQFHDDFEGGVLTNANCGGENCHRGAVLGALLAAAISNTGENIPQKWKDGLGSAVHVRKLLGKL